ncbi:MAG TPA: TerD family protein [Burkholderiales bacterium]|jgi:Uncharacterized proteins involved in stress response, homologs of TerZ and putative cAMP-binding protein CABP1
MIGNLTSECDRTGRRVAISGDLVMGLRWNGHEPGTQMITRRPDLDAFCVLFDVHGRSVDLVHPGRTRNGNGSVVHTGDSTTGASEWDDERIFVFLDALPEEISMLAFVVRSATGDVFRDVPGASCHVSDAITECAYLRADLYPYGYSIARCMAALSRRPDGWEILDRNEAGHVAISAESLVLATEGKLE